MLHPIVHDGIFHAVGDELRMTEKIGIDGGINEETGFGSHVLCPVQLLDLCVDVICGLCLEGGNRHEYARSSTQTEIGGIEHAQVACERDSTALYLHIVGAQFDKFFGKDLLQTFEGLCQH